MLSYVTACDFLVLKLQKFTLQGVALAVFEGCQMNKLCRQRLTSRAGEPVGYIDNSQH